MLGGDAGGVAPMKVTARRTAIMAAENDARRQIFADAIIPPLRLVPKLPQPGQLRIAVSFL